MTKTIVFSPRPINLSVVRNGYNQADSFSMTFDAKDVPISAELIRAGNTHIKIYNNRGNDAPEATLPKILKCGAIPPDQRPTFSGVIDDVESDYGTRGGTITLQGQDFTALFIERKFVDAKSKTDKGGKVKKNKPAARKGQRRIVLSKQKINVFLQGMIDEANKGVVCLVNETGIPDEKLPIVGKGASKNNAKSGFPIKLEATFWDVMYGVASLHGFILYVRNNEVVLARPLKVQRGVKRPLFTMVWGNNIENIKINRKMGKQRVPRIRVQSYNDRTKKTISQTYPVSKGQKNVSGVGVIWDEILVKKVHGITDSDILLRTAENWYNVLARGEQSVKIKTRDMVDADGKDLLQITAGDLMQVSFKPYNKEKIEALKDGERYAFLRKQGLPEEAARRIAQNTQLLSGFDRPMYVRNAEFTYDITSGFSMSVEVINVVNIKKTEDMT